MLSSLLRAASRTLPLAALGALAACGRDRSPAEERARRAEANEGDIVIGVAFPWSAYPEIRYGQGIELAVAEANAAKGVLGRRIRIEKVDDHGSVDEGRVVAHRLANDPSVVAVIGHLQSFVSIPAAAVYDLSGIVMLSPTATDPELTTQGYRRVFRTTFTDKLVGHQMAEYASSRGYRRVGIYYIRNNYGRGLANAFEERANELGVQVPTRQSYDASGDVSAQSFAPTVREWKQQQQLDAVFLAGEVPSATKLIEAARAEGLDVPILGGDALSSPALLAAGSAAEGTVVATVFHPDEPRPAARAFVERFRAKYGALPDQGAALGYDAVRLLVDAMRRAGSASPDRLAGALRDTRNLEGVTATFAFDSTGELRTRPVVKMVVRGGQFAYLPSDSTSRVAVR